jgi:hypothetical protein
MRRSRTLYVQYLFGCGSAALGRGQATLFGFQSKEVEPIEQTQRFIITRLTPVSFDDDGRSCAGSLLQAESDRLLGEAENHLRIIEHPFSTRTVSLEHHHNARAPVAEAFNEVRVALRIN